MDQNNKKNQTLNEFGGPLEIAAERAVEAGVEYGVHHLPAKARRRLEKASPTHIVKHVPHIDQRVGLGRGLARYVAKHIDGHPTRRHTPIQQHKKVNEAFLAELSRLTLQSYLGKAERHLEKIAPEANSRLVAHQRGFEVAPESEVNKLFRNVANRAIGIKLANLKLRGSLPGYAGVHVPAAKRNLGSFLARNRFGSMMNLARKNGRVISMKNEETLHELSKPLLLRYGEKALQRQAIISNTIKGLQKELDATAHEGDTHYRRHIVQIQNKLRRRYWKRQRGIDRAGARLDVMESSPERLGLYVRKAASTLQGDVDILKSIKGSSKASQAAQKYWMDRVVRRVRGIKTAQSKLTSKAKVPASVPQKISTQLPTLPLPAKNGLSKLGTTRINELSTPTLKRYFVKADRDRDATIDALRAFHKLLPLRQIMGYNTTVHHGLGRRLVNRELGMANAVKKLAKRGKLNELSNKFLRAYLTKAVADRNASVDASKAIPSAAPALERQMKKRADGIVLATKKIGRNGPDYENLVKEETLNELSPQAYKHYIGHASRHMKRMRDVGRSFRALASVDNPMMDRQDLMKMRQGVDKIIQKRKNGLEMARRLRNKRLGEAVQLDELTRKLLQRYIARAEGQRFRVKKLGQDMWRQVKDGHYKGKPAMRERDMKRVTHYVVKRTKGISLAKRKILKKHPMAEGINESFLNEISTQMVARYVVKRHGVEPHPKLPDQAAILSNSNHVLKSIEDRLMNGGILTPKEIALYSRSKEGLVNALKRLRQRAVDTAEDIVGRPLTPKQKDFIFANIVPRLLHSGKEQVEAENHAKALAQTSNLINRAKKIDELHMPTLIRYRTKARYSLSSLSKMQLDNASRRHKRLKQRYDPEQLFIRLNNRLNGIQSASYRINNDGKIPPSRRKKVNEDFLAELKSGTLVNYVIKARKPPLAYRRKTFIRHALYKLDQRGDLGLVPPKEGGGRPFTPQRRVMKRRASYRPGWGHSAESRAKISQKTKKNWAQKKKVDEAFLAELSPETLKGYLRVATNDAAHLHRKLDRMERHPRGMLDPEKYAAVKHKSDKRDYGISIAWLKHKHKTPPGVAKRKMRRALHELSKATIANYVTKRLGLSMAAVDKNLYFTPVGEKSFVLQKAAASGIPGAVRKYKNSIAGNNRAVVRLADKKVGHANRHFDAMQVTPRQLNAISHHLELAGYRNKELDPSYVRHMRDFIKGGGRFGGTPTRLGEEKILNELSSDLLRRYINKTFQSQDHYKKAVRALSNAASTHGLGREHMRDINPNPPLKPEFLIKKFQQRYNGRQLAHEKLARRVRYKNNMLNDKGMSQYRMHAKEILKYIKKKENK